MRELRRKLSDGVEIGRTAAGMLLLATFYGACILGAFCALVLAVTYAGAMICLEDRYRSYRRQFMTQRDKMLNLPWSAEWRKIATKENQQ